MLVVTQLTQRNIVQNHIVSNNIRQQILDKLESLGYRNIPNSFSLDGEECRFDSSGNHPHDKAESFRVETLSHGGYAVVHCSHREPSLSGSFTVGQQRVVQHYLQKKGFKTVPQGVRLLYHERADKYGPHIVVPVLCPDTSSEIAHQTIWSDGTKLFSKGCKLKNGYFTIFNTTPAAAPITYVAEGLATAMSVHEATGLPCIVAFSMARMVKVAANVQERMRDTRIVLVLDKGSEDEIAKAQKKHKTCFTTITPTLESGTDFNDLMQSNGIDEVKKQLHLASILTLPASNGKVDVPTISGGNFLAKIDQAYWFAETGHIFIPDEDPANDRWIRNQSYNRKHWPWFELHPERQFGAMVYDPTKPPRTIFDRGNTQVLNTYCAPKDKPGCRVKGERLRELLLTGCRYAEERTWLEQWIAWQVQRPGQLLDCHPLLASAAQRTGKTTLANVVGAMIGQSNYKEIAPEDIANPNSQHYASESVLMFVDEFDPASFANPESSRLTKRMLTQTLITAPKKYINSYTAPRRANCIFATNRLDKLHYCSREERIRIILWREDINFQHGDGAELHALAKDDEAVDWLRGYFKKYPLKDNLMLRKNHASPSETTALSYHDDPYGEWLRSTNIADMPYVTNAEVYEKAREEGGPAADIDFNNYAAKDSYHKQIGAAFKRMGWRPTSIKISGKVQRVFYNGALDDWRTRQRPIWTVKHQDTIVPPRADDDITEPYVRQSAPLGKPARPFTHASVEEHDEFPDKLDLEFRDLAILAAQELRKRQLKITPKGLWDIIQISIPWFRPSKSLQPEVVERLRQIIAEEEY